LRIWFGYYSTLFGADNCFIVDHGSDKVSPYDALKEFSANAALNIITIPFTNPCASRENLNIKNHFDHYRFAALSSFINGLLNYYDVVIYNDSDEIFLVDPLLHANLKDFILSQARFSGLCGVGIEVVHDYNSEPKYNPHEFLLAQRKKFVVRIHHSKPHIIGRPCRIMAHGMDKEFSISRGLFLAHLKFFDRDYLLEKQVATQNSYHAGLGDRQSRWRFNDAEITEHLNEMLARPLSSYDIGLFDEVCPHTAKPIGHAILRSNIEAFETQKKAVRTQYELRKGFAEKDIKKIQNRLYALPSRFSNIL